MCDPHNILIIVPPFAYEPPPWPLFTAPKCLLVLTQLHAATSTPIPITKPKTTTGKSIQKIAKPLQALWKYSEVDKEEVVRPSCMDVRTTVT